MTPKATKIALYLGVPDVDAARISPHPGPFTGGGVGHETKLVAVAATALRVVNERHREARVRAYFLAGFGCRKYVCVYVVCGWAGLGRLPFTSPQSKTKYVGGTHRGNQPLGGDARANRTFRCRHK